MITVLLVDDHALVRLGIQTVLEDSKQIRVVGTCSSGEAALQWHKHSSADVVLMDISLPELSGLDVLPKIIRLAPEAQIIMLTMHEEVDLARRAIEAGALGFLSKNVSADELIKAVRRVAQGHRYLSNGLAQGVVLNSLQPYRAKQDALSLLSSREFQIFWQVAQGNKPHRIAETLQLSPKTVNAYRYRIYKKLALNNDVDLVRFAIRSGISKDYLE